MYESLKYDRTKPLNQTIVFWAVAWPMRLKELNEPKAKVVLEWMALLESGESHTLCKICLVSMLIGWG